MNAIKTAAIKGTGGATGGKGAVVSGVFELKYTYYCGRYSGEMVPEQQPGHIFESWFGGSKEFKQNGGFVL
ncbi:hypothetical protein [Pedobacter hartonius]|nr:hypothetical protein [Pedobacter hartonius]